MSQEIWKVRPIAWHKASGNELSQRFYNILQKWIPYANQQYQSWSGRPECGHFFGGAYWYGLETAYTASVYALLAAVGDYDESLTGISHEEIKTKAIRAIRYLGFTHDTGPDDCVRAEGRNQFSSLCKWGGKGKSFFPASQTGVTIASFGLSAWLLWDHLDNETKGLVQNVLTDYADRWSVEVPRNGTYHDTQSEENAWTAGGIAAALAMFEHHPNREKWKNGFIEWSISAITTSKDRLAETWSRTGTPLKRVKTVTFHPDFTTENHGFAHPGYICAGINLRGIHALYSLLGDQEILDSVLYNNEQLYERTIKIWAQFDGLAVPVQGQDWWYNRQHERQLTHAIMNVLHGDRDSARYERNALDTIESIQNSNNLGCLLEEAGEQCIISGYQTAKDMEHTSAKDLVASCLFHLFGGPGADPSDTEEMEVRLSGVYKYPFGCTVIHRTPNHFSSFSWRNRVMALTLPRKSLWCVTPLTASYTGTVQFKADGEMSERNVHANTRVILDTEKENVRIYENGFGAVATLSRGDEELFQDVAFVSLPEGATVYMEQIHIRKRCTVSELQTGLIGIRNERYRAMPQLAPGQRSIYFPDRSAVFSGFYGKEPNHSVDYPPASFVNVDNEIGYVLFGSQGIRYINQHEYPKWKGIEDILVLNRLENAEFASPQSLQPFVVVSLPNQTQQETMVSAQQTYPFSCDQENVVLLETAAALVYANFQHRERIVRAHRRLENPIIPLFAGNTRIEVDVYTWSGKLDAYTSGYLDRDIWLEAAGLHNLSLDIFMLADRMILVNLSSQNASLQLHRKNGASRNLIIDAGTNVILQIIGGDEHEIQFDQSKHDA